MIAPVSPPPSKRRDRTALSAARHAVAEALFDADGRPRRGLSHRRGWIAVGLVLAAMIAYLAALLWWSLDA
jgi:hypothetical protein